MRRMIRRLGFVLSLTAALTLASHISHADSDHFKADPSHHCCICHHTSFVPTAPAQNLIEPVVIRTFYKPQIPKIRIAESSLSSNLSRAPPASA